MRYHCEVVVVVDVDPDVVVVVGVDPDVVVVEKTQKLLLIPGIKVLT